MTCFDRQSRKNYFCFFTFIRFTSPGSLTNLFHSTKLYLYDTVVFYCERFFYFLFFIYITPILGRSPPPLLECITPIPPRSNCDESLTILILPKQKKKDEITRKFKKKGFVCTQIFRFILLPSMNEVVWIR